MSTEKSSNKTSEPNIDQVMFYADDLLEIVLLCNAALAQDSPESPKYYLNQILGYAMGPLPRSMRPRVEEYLANKEYLPPSNLILWLTMSESTTEVVMNVITEPKTLTSERREALQDAFVNAMIDDMELKAVYEYLFAGMSETLDQMTEADLLQEISEFYPEILEQVKWS